MKPFIPPFFCAHLAIIRFPALAAAKQQQPNTDESCAAGEHHDAAPGVFIQPDCANGMYHAPDQQAEHDCDQDLALDLCGIRSGN